MTGRERIFRILNDEDIDRAGLWIGNPTFKALKNYKKYFHKLTQSSLGCALGDDMTWINAEIYHGPNGMWNTLGGEKRTSHSQAGVFADTENVDDILKYPYYPNIKYMKYGITGRRLKRARKKGLATFSGMWAPVWHLLMDFFGMEGCFIKMYTAPEQIDALMNIMTSFYLEANEILYRKYGDLIDVMFFGNDMGSQLDCMISPDMFRELIFPYYKKLIDQAKHYGKKVALHSCGAIDKIIPDIINMGVDILHPIQAKAVGMDAENLNKKYNGQIVFLGGIDTQNILPFGSAVDVENEVIRLRRLFNDRIIISGSHEALLENVPPQNLKAMCTATQKTLIKL